MKKLFLSALLVAFAVAVQAGGEDCTKAAGQSGCPAQAEKSSGCCSGAAKEQTKATTCPAMKKNTETTSKQKLQSPKDSSLAKK